MSTKKYVSLDKLSLYDEKIKALIGANDTATLNSAKSYADSLASNYDAAGSANTALADAKTYTDGQISTVNTTIAGVKTIAEQGVADAATADGKAVAAQGEIDALEAYVGTFTASEGVDTVVKYIDAKTANIASDETVGAIADRVTQAETDIDNIEKDYLTSADKTELEGKITTAQTAADTAQSHSEGVATSLATETSERKAADEGLDGRITTLEGQITGLSGAMHFEGVVETDPTTITEGYENGDTVIYGNKEYVWNNGAFVEFGDVSAQAEAITSLTGRMDTAEGKITTAEGKITTLEGAVATKAEKTYVDEQVQALTTTDSGLDARIKTLETAVGESGSVATDIATAKQEAIDSAVATASADATTKANTAETNAKGYADGLNTAMDERMDVVEAKAHEHTNKALLDTYTQTEANLADAVAKKHEHSNLTVLEGITSTKVTAWDASEQNAKTYADGLNTAMDTRVATLESWHNSFTECSEDDINSLFTA